MGFIYQQRIHHLSADNQRAIPGLSDLSRWTIGRSFPKKNMKQESGCCMSDAVLAEMHLLLEVDEPQPDYGTQEWDAWKTFGDATQDKIEINGKAESRLHRRDLRKLSECADRTAAAISSVVARIVADDLGEHIEVNELRLEVTPLPRLPHIALSARLLPLPFLTRRTAG